MKKDYLTSLAAEAVVIASYLWVFRVVAVQLGRHGFGEYAVSRRALALVLPVAVLGMDIGVARYVAYARARGTVTPGYLTAAGGLCLVVVLALSVILLGFQGPIARLFYGDPAYVGLVTPLPVLLLGGVMHGLAYGELRGESRIQVANLLLVVNQAMVPLTSVYLGHQSVSLMLILMGSGWIVASGVVLMTLQWTRTGLATALPELVRFGVPRVPGDFLQLGLFAVPAIVVAHIADLTQAGTIAFGVATLSMLGSAMSPIGMVLLPRAAFGFAAGSARSLREEVVKLAAVAGLVLVLATILLELLADQALKLYLGQSFVSGAGALRVLALAALPWGLYMTLRSVLDARHVKPINALNMGVAFVTFVSVMIVLVRAGVAPEQAVELGFVAGLYLLGMITLVAVWLAVRGDSSRAASGSAAEGLGSPADSPAISLDDTVGRSFRS